MNAVILAAGRGTRMGTLTDHTPKPLLPVRGRPILEHILAGLSRAGIDRAMIITGYLGDQIEARLGERACGIGLEYRRQDDPTGTASALLLARDWIDADSFFLSWGDILVDPGAYAALRRDFERRRCDGLLAVNEVDDPWRGAAVYVDREMHISRLVEKPPRGTSATRWNNAGISVLTPLVLEFAARLQPSERGEYELPQALAAMIDDGRRLCAHPLRGFWSDLGTPADLERAEATYPAPLAD